MIIRLNHVGLLISDHFDLQRWQFHLFNLLDAPFKAAVIRDPQPSSPPAAAVSS